ncbi:hypothetical protein HYN59_14040 [Flavobacterium album]|uniref:Uncharacterized protein n=1 Tax=Flavobacterium album TaxID=2175091 RepID=A0A2S1R0R4_9FLAO|nr:hypothetical protein [Flavobacterium album]AWH86159.1 hypothetical protein HYN59_14040 [Flavobacterium album]
MKFSHLLIFITLNTTALFAQKQGIPSVFFLDSLEITMDDFRKINPLTLTLTSVYYDSTAVELVGERGRRGVVYLETKQFAKKRYWNFFRSKSKEYRKLFPTKDSDMNAVYILNDTVQTGDDFHGDLALIDNETFISIKIIDKKSLKKKYSITDKDYGIVIEATEPKE